MCVGASKGIKLGLSKKKKPHVGNSSLANMVR
jgi:hypothetical protein